MRLPIVSISIALTTICVFLLGGALPDQLIWHNGVDTKIWQWLSAHFAHISTEHLSWNIVAFVILGSIIEQTSRKVLGLALAAGVIGVNLYLASLFTLDAYAGLSGMLNSMLLVALYFLYQRADYKVASVVTLVLSLAKIMVETFFGLSIFSTLAWPAVPEAHLAGLIGGAVLVVILEMRKQKLLSLDFINFSDAHRNPTGASQTN
ncbi:MAG: rhomboid family intramembrane serine protease [Arenicella sp.]|nr:rhomboid family intramembrane serine protease [Arenicella sp.]